MIKNRSKPRVKKNRSDLVERIFWRETCLAYIIRANFFPEKTTFLTPPDYNQQLGYIVYQAGGEIQRHVHRLQEQYIIGVPEILIIKKGRCEVDIFNTERELVATRELREGDIILMLNCGHGFRMLEDTIFIEIKQGPYLGFDEKKRF